MPCLGKGKKGAQKKRELNDLRQLGLNYHNSNETNHKGPATLDDFIKFAQQADPGATAVIANLQSGMYVIYLGVDISKLPDGAGNTVLGYEANVPTAGRPPLVWGGSTTANDGTPG